MQREDMVLVDEICLHHNIELSFIRSLHEQGIIEMEWIEESVYLPVSQLGHLEKIIRLHVELEINIEGIDTITHLLERMKAMQRQITELTNRLNAYEK